MRLGAIIAVALLCVGCAAVPDVLQEPQYHNPFPQLYRVAILPFTNLSQDPTLDTRTVDLAYYNELQTIPGFEVMPVGVTRQKLASYEQLHGPITPATDMQRVAQLMGVDVILQGAVTEFTPYYPPRIGLSVNWYSANPGFHRIPAGYGLPWGTSEEEYIPDSLVQPAEFELAREQLKTQTPEFDRAHWPPADMQQPAPSIEAPDEPAPDGTDVEFQQTGHRPGGESGGEELLDELPPPPGMELTSGSAAIPALPEQPDLPIDWPDPRGFIPPAPSPQRPKSLPQSGPVIEHTKLYRGNDEELTRRLSEYFYFRDEARFGGWQAYLQRSQDFIQFCCYMHITETLAARGGAGQSRVVWRWPIRRYER
ncbi:MAG: hypothetical protein QGG36_07355 [Pirellulaceae bacterium]|jgi:hypothetical protein|nr:hypothetical protein [Pirellulaceae bacterium]MDP7015600.1 hypothetical protein [Pirellulaceae bacterium]